MSLNLHTYHLSKISGYNYIYFCMYIYYTDINIFIFYIYHIPYIIYYIIISLYILNIHRLDLLIWYHYFFIFFWVYHLFCDIEMSDVWGFVAFFTWYIHRSLCLISTTVTPRADDPEVADAEGFVTYRTKILRLKTLASKQTAFSVCEFACEMPTWPRVPNYIFGFCIWQFSYLLSTTPVIRTSSKCSAF